METFASRSIVQAETVVRPSWWTPSRTKMNVDNVTEDQVIWTQVILDTFDLFAEGVTTVIWTQHH